MSVFLFVSYTITIIIYRPALLKSEGENLVAVLPGHVAKLACLDNTSIKLATRWRT